MKGLVSTIDILGHGAYEKEYSKHKSVGYIESLKTWADSTWLEFLDLITWYFGEDDENELETNLIAALKQSSFYNQRLRGREEHVISLLVDKFDKKQNLPNFADRFIHASEIKLTAKEVEAGEYNLSDPAWTMWEKLEPSDNRNLIDKVRSVSSTFNEKLLSSWCRSASLSRNEQKEHKHDKSILSLRYRVFESCYVKLASFMQNKGSLDTDQLAKYVEELVDSTEADISELSKDYKYPLNNAHSIRGMILELIDSCFLAFDDNGDQN